MIDIFTLEKNIKQNKIENCYVFCGSDEQLIKNGVDSVIDRVLDKSFQDLNYMKFDGDALESFEPVINACQTLPFMSDRKVVLIYRASFIQDEKGDKSGKSKDKNSNNPKSKFFNEIIEYVGKVPSHCVLIIYDVFNSKRDKPGGRLIRLDKKVCVVKADRLKGQLLESKIKSFFEARNKKIERIELRLFSNMMEENNLSIIENEVEKLCCFTCDKEITREDIKKLFLKNSDDDIFDLVNTIAQKKIKEAIEVFNELIYKGEKIPYILNMVERQFNQLFKVKIAIQCSKTKQDIMKELNIKSEYAIDILIKQSQKFTLKQIQRALELCLNTEQRIKSSSIDEKTELELLIINTIAA